MACQAVVDERSFKECPPSPSSAPAWQPSSLASLVAKAGGGNRVRTGDPELAKLVLYQLSYAPAQSPINALIYKYAKILRSGNGVTQIRPMPGNSFITNTTDRCRPALYSMSQRHINVCCTSLLRKEVIQPQVPLRLPCYDFIPITTHTLDTYPPCGLNQRLRVQTAFMM